RSGARGRPARRAVPVRRLCATAPGRRAQHAPDRGRRRAARRADRASGAAGRSGDLRRRRRGRALLPPARPLGRGRVRRRVPRRNRAGGAVGRVAPARGQRVAQRGNTGFRANEARLHQTRGGRNPHPGELHWSAGVDPGPMSVLRTIESKMESLFEAVFGRPFRTNVQPVELARKLVKEMDDHRTVSVSRVYVPNEYSIYLAPPDREQFSDFEESLCGELADYVTEHARREGYVLLTAAVVKLETDTDLDIGVFGIATRFVRARRPIREERNAPKPPTPAAAGATQVYKAVKPEQA